ncbi:sugar transporter [Niveomyces insectorum RCEF 264]|uniref:Sugar transporter n=1 Tax=Niveomyces insectorum RCEF 264 TaxID=1081102 RepID=A0A167T701_9HYPO|nr:sugar transporter [Niveomyces insectorum RCEF 264]
MVWSDVKIVGEELAAVLPQNRKPWWREPQLVRLNFTIASMVILASANGYDGSLMGSFQALPYWQKFMDSPTGAWLGFVNAVQSLGVFLLLPVVAWSSNKFGRKKTIFVAYFWLALGVGLQTGAVNPAMFVMGRLFVGGTSAFYAASAPLLVTESAYPTHRAILTTVYNTGWYIGSTTAAWATYGTRNYPNNWSWMIPSILQLLIPVIALPGLFMAEESPRWLCDQGRDEEARKFLVKYHAGGDENSPLVAFEMAEIQQTLEMERNSQLATSWRDMIRTKGNRHRLWISITAGIFAQWNGVGIVSYYLPPVLGTIGVTSVTKQTLISAFLQLWNLFVAMGSAFFVDSAGRRPLFLTSCFGMLASYIIITGLSGSFANTGASATGTAVIPFLFIYYAFYDIAFNPLLVGYICEIWPYHLRARGLAGMNIATQGAVFFNIFVNPIALDAIAWKYYAVYVAILVVITVVVWFSYPETKGHTLEEMARLFDGDDAVPAQGAVLDQVTKVESEKQIENQA